MTRFVSHSTQQTEEFAAQLAKKLRTGDVLAYKGGMGMGKTAFTRGLCRGLGIDEQVSSPTFSLVHEYRGDNITLYHFDMYRVEDINDLYSTGYFDYLSMGGILAVEWSEHIQQALDQNTIYVTLSQPEGEEDTREIVVEGDERF